MVHFHLVHVRFTRLLFRSVFCTHSSLPLEGREVVIVYLWFSCSSPSVEIMSSIKLLSMPNNLPQFILVVLVFEGNLLSLLVTNASPNSACDFVIMPQHVSSSSPRKSVLLYRTKLYQLCFRGSFLNP